jgi:arylamine N-acetyltransferase
MIEALWSVVETRMRNRYPPPTSLKQLEDLLQEKWYKIPLENVQKLYESIPRNMAVLKVKGGATPY